MAKRMGRWEFPCSGYDYLTGEILLSDGGLNLTQV